MHVGVWLPRAKARACSRATGATLFSVTTIVEAEFFFNMERFVVAFFVLVTDHFVWACNNAASTSGAQTSVNDFFVQLFPLVRPALESCRGCLGNGHVNTLRHGLHGCDVVQLAQCANDLV
jgi:hypothetical protein